MRSSKWGSHYRARQTKRDLFPSKQDFNSKRTDVGPQSRNQFFQSGYRPLFFPFWWGGLSISAFKTGFGPQNGTRPDTRPVTSGHNIGQSEQDLFPTIPGFFPIWRAPKNGAPGIRIYAPHIGIFAGLVFLLRSALLRGFSIEHIHGMYSYVNVKS